MARYLERYREIEERDFIPFVELLILSASEFNARNADWLRENLERFGYDGDSRKSLTLTAAPRPAEAPMEIEKPARKVLPKDSTDPKSPSRAKKTGSTIRKA
jgi:hypothetical protein